MIGKQRPGIATRAALVSDGAQSFQEIVTIAVVPENIAFFDSSDNHMLQGTGGINAGFSLYALFMSMPDRK
jgi:hypothetical protein